MKTNVGLLTFNNITYVHTGLTAEKEVFNQSFWDSISSCCSGKAFTHIALNVTGRIFANSSRNITTTKAAVLLTDSSCNGKDKCPEPLENVGQWLNERGVKIFIVDISSKSDKEVEAVGSLSGNAYKCLNRFSDLKSRKLVSELSDEVCKGITFFNSLLFIINVIIML